MLGIKEGLVIIDAHVHLGHDVVFDHEFTEQELIVTLDACGVDAGLVQPFIVPPLHEPQRQIHDRIKALIDRYPGRFYGMASLNPHCGQEYYWGEMRRCVHELGFLGLKLHPIAHAANPCSVDGRMAFEAARELKVPIMVHTGNQQPFAVPQNLFYLAHDFKDVPIVMAHAGGGLYSEALLVARENDNVYLDTSWVPERTALRFVKELGADRLMFASDHPDNVPVELHKWRSIGLSEADLEWVLGKTLAQVYGVA